MSDLLTVFTLPGLMGSRFAGLRVINVPTPAVGANFVQVVPGGRAWLIHSVFLVFTTSATAATRTMRLRVFAADEEIQRIAPSTTQAASLTRRYTGAFGLGNQLTLDEFTFGLPAQLLLLPGWGIDSLVNNIQVGDSIGPIRFLVSEFYYPS